MTNNGKVLGSGTHKIKQKVSEHDWEIPQLNTVDQPTVREEEPLNIKKKS